MERIGAAADSGIGNMFSSKNLGGADDWQVKKRRDSISKSGWV